MNALAWLIGPGMIFGGLWLCAPSDVTFDQVAAARDFRIGVCAILAAIALLLCQLLYLLTGVTPWLAAALLVGQW